MDNELTFGADCVIRLQDLGQFKDYTETIDNLIQKLKNLKLSKMPLMCEQLLEVIEADPEDTFFLPSFKQFLGLIIDQNWTSFDLKQDIRKSFLKFELAVIEQSFFSPTFSEQIIKSLIVKCEKYVHQDIFQQILLNTLLKLSQKIVYIDEQEAIVTLFNYLQENLLFKSTTLHYFRIAVYLEICDKLLRNHHIRQKFNQNFVKDNYVFLCKLSLWNKDRVQFQQYKKEIEVQQYFNSQFLQKALLSFQKTFE